MHSKSNWLPFFLQGCYDLVTSFMETNMGIIAGVAFGIAFSQVYSFGALNTRDVFAFFFSLREGLGSGTSLRLLISS